MHGDPKTLVEILDLETLDDNLFRGASRDLGGRSVYGGQVVSQALIAASRTVAVTAEVVPHSLHAYFLRRGDMDRPIVYEVDRIRDGRSFMARRVQAIQHGEPILSMICSFQKAEPGLEYQKPMPQVPPPEALPSLEELRREWQALPGLTPRQRSAFSMPVPLEVRRPYIADPVHPPPRAPEQAFWFRSPVPLPDDPLVHQAVLTYASDLELVPTMLYPHGRGLHDEQVICASIDHAVWFHRHGRADEWLLYALDTTTSQNSRGFARGCIYDRSGRLLASTAQEGMIRDLRLAVPG